MGRIILILCFSFVSLVTFSQSDAQRLYNCINEQFRLIDDAVIDFNRGIEIYDGDTILATYKKLLIVTENAIAELEKVKAPANAYYKSAFELFRFYLRIYEDDYYSAVAILFSLDITDGDIVDIERIFDRVELKESIYLNALIREEEVFCKKHNIMEK